MSHTEPTSYLVAACKLVENVLIVLEWLRKKVEENHRTYFGFRQRIKELLFIAFRSGFSLSGMSEW